MKQWRPKLKSRYPSDNCRPRVSSCDAALERFVAGMASPRHIKNSPAIAVVATMSMFTLVCILCG